MSTPQITLRVPAEVKDKWSKTAAAKGLNLSEAIRSLMNSWVDEVDNGGGDSVV